MQAEGAARDTVPAAKSFRIKFAIATAFGNATSWWVRLRDEGHDVRVYIQPQLAKTTANGIIQKAGTFDELLKWAGEGPSVVLFDSSGLGEQADRARRAGHVVVGGGTFCDKLEKDRTYGFRIAQQAGAMLPDFKEFASFADAKAHAAHLRKGTYFKSDRYIDGDATAGADSGKHQSDNIEDIIREAGAHGRCIIQEKVDGVPLSTARWWNGMSFVGPYEGTYENKKLMNDNVGPSTGCSFNAVWMYASELPAPAVELGFERLEAIFRKEQAPPGIYDMNSVVDRDGTVWFLEWTPRLGYDADMTASRLIPDLGEFLYNVGTGRQVDDFSTEIAFSLRIGIPPYPWEFGEQYHKGNADGRPLRDTDGLWENHFIAYNVREEGGQLLTAGTEGIVGLSLATADTLSDAAGSALAYAKDGLRIRGKMFRTDGEDDVTDAAEKLIASGIDIHPGLLV